MFEWYETGFRLLLSAFAITGWGCGSPTSPSKIVRVTTIRYQRVYSASGSGSGQMMLQMNIPVAGEQSGRSNIPFCFPQPAGDGSFLCDALNWDVPVNEECWVDVDDPAVGRGVATALFVNGQRVLRTRIAGNGTEYGDFRFDERGHIQ